jgi:hypothetical protein
MGFSNPINQPGNVNPPGIVQNPWQKKKWKWIKSKPQSQFLS